MLCACPLLLQRTEMSPEKANKSTAPPKALVKDEEEASDDGIISTVCVETASPYTHRQAPLTASMVWLLSRILR